MDKMGSRELVEWMAFYELEEEETQKRIEEATRNAKG
jgi:hypothetical protein